MNRSVSARPVASASRACSAVGDAGGASSISCHLHAPHPGAWGPPHPVRVMPAGRAQQTSDRSSTSDERTCHDHQLKIDPTRPDCAPLPVGAVVAVLLAGCSDDGINLPSPPARDAAVDLGALGPLPPTGAEAPKSTPPRSRRRCPTATPEPTTPETPTPKTTPTPRPTKTVAVTATVTPRPGDRDGHCDRHRDADAVRDPDAVAHRLRGPGGDRRRGRWHPRVVVVAGRGRRSPHWPGTCSCGLVGVRPGTPRWSGSRPRSPGSADSCFRSCSRPAPPTPWPVAGT